MYDILQIEVNDMKLKIIESSWSGWSNDKPEEIEREYDIKLNEKYVIKTEFVSYGAGIPEPEETPGAVFTVTDDGYFIENLNRYLPRLTMAVGLIANHSLAAGSDFYEQREYFLTSFFEPQTSIILEIKRISLFKYMRLSDPARHNT